SDTLRYPNARLPVRRAASHATVVVAIALLTWSSPAPTRVIGASTFGRNTGSVYTSGSAVFISAALIAHGERFGYASSISAAAPDTIGADPDVPLNASSPVPVPTTAETEAPGAEISGLIWL